jgi:hypothetical protein
MAKHRIVDLRRAAKARAFGIRNPLIAIEEAQRTEHIGPALAIAMLEQESGGKNLWGHDPTIFIGGFDKQHSRFWTGLGRRGYVNEAGYREYKKQRRASGNRLMQGVGPMQLTWWEFQDGADHLGGSWNPRANIRYGLRRLDALIDQHGVREGIKRYNGTGPRADAYARSVLERRAKWRGRFGI